MFERMFNPDNPVFSAINKIVDVIWLSILWMVCSLPLVTIGPASCALYYAVVKSVRKDMGHATREFFRGFKSNFWKGLIAGVIVAVLSAALLYADVPLLIHVYQNGEVQNTIMFILLCIKVVVLIGVACWLFPLISRFNEKLLKLAESTLYLLVRYFWISIPAIILVTVAAAAVIVEWLLAAIVPGIAAWILTFLLEPVLEHIADEDVTQAMAENQM